MTKSHDRDDPGYRHDDPAPRIDLPPVITPLAVTTNATTLAAAVTPTDDRIKLTSGATVAAGQFAYVDRECFQILGQVSPTDTTLWLVSRGVSGTMCTAHNSGANVKTGPATHFLMFDPAGAANAANITAIPAINVFTGNAFDVNASAWRQVGTNGVAQGTAVWP